VIFAGPLLLASILAAPTPSSERIAQAIGAALQADIPRALRELEPVDVSSLPKKDAQFVRCMRDRFGQETRSLAPSAPFVERVLATYRTYWREAVSRPERRDAAEHELATELRRLVGAKAANMDEIERILQQRLAQSGWHSLHGRTGLLREFMAWNKEEHLTRSVRLPEGPKDVQVVLLRGFVSLGWADYATCGRRGTGGWATDQALFAVVPRYESLDSEEFQVTFLGHEAQHFADRARFQNLEPWELEYRAKLVELASAKQTRDKVLRKFIEDRGSNPASPHSYANRKVLLDMVSAMGLGSVSDLRGSDIAQFQSAARSLLIADTRRRLGQ
jgi:hypothetical protein